MIKKGFTLIEVIIVVALVAVLSAAAYIIINPAKGYQDSRNSKRTSDLALLLNAITQYTTDEGQLVTDFGSIPLCTGNPSYAYIGTGFIDLNAKLVSKYIVDIPKDPSGGTTTNTLYTICLISSTGNRVQLAAPQTEGGVTTITVKR